MIAHSHDVDPNLPYSAGNGTSRDVAMYLGWLTRDRRIALGKRLISACDKARDGKSRYFSHFQESRRTVCVYLVSPEPRPDRVKHLQMLTAFAYIKYGVRSYGVTTEPLGVGRSYDFVVVRSSPPPELVVYLKEVEDPFSSDQAL